MVGDSWRFLLAMVRSLAVTLLAAEQKSTMCRYVKNVRQQLCGDGRGVWRGGDYSRSPLRDRCQACRKAGTGQSRGRR